MKLATLKDGSRDGQLVVVSRDLKTAHYAADIAGRLQTVLDDWAFYAPQLQDLFDALNAGRARHPFPFDPKHCMAPLPRAYQWADGSAYVNHVELVRKARGAEMPPEFWTDPLMYQAAPTISSARTTTSCARAKPSASTSRPRSRSSPATSAWAPRPSKPPKASGW